MDFSVIERVLLQNLVKDLAGIFLAVFDSAVERNNIAGRYKSVVLFFVFKLGFYFFFLR